MAKYSSTEFFEEFDVSRETKEKLLEFDALFVDATSRMNLVAKSTIDERWERHFRDSAQLLRFIPETAKTLIDIGSGGGFPRSRIGDFRR